MTMQLTEMKANANQASKLLKLMSNQHRLLILCLLAKEELSVSQIMHELQLPQSTLSQHLGVLRDEGLVETRRHAQTIFYKLASKEVKVIIGTMYDLFCAN